MLHLSPPPPPPPASCRLGGSITTGSKSYCSDIPINRSRQHPRRSADETVLRVLVSFTIPRVLIRPRGSIGNRSGPLRLKYCCFTPGARSQGGSGTQGKWERSSGRRGVAAPSGGRLLVFRGRKNVGFTLSSSREERHAGARVGFHV